MALKTHEAFNHFLRHAVNFTGSEREQAGKSQRYLRESLDSYAANTATFPDLIDGDFLSGSFGRKTAIHPLDDIDVFVILDGGGLAVIRQGVTQPARVEGSHRGSSGLRAGPYWTAEGLVSAASLLDSFRDALRDSIYPNSEVGKDGQAVNAWLSSYGLGLDVVPAFHIVPWTGQDYYLIPAGGGRDGWLETNPKLDAARLEEVGGSDVAKLRDVIRLLRYWNRHTNKERLSGYHVEVLALRVLEWTTITQRRYAVRDALWQFPDSIAAICPSQTGFGSNVDAYLSQTRRDGSVTASRLGAAAAKLACDAESAGDHSQAINYWRMVFGDAFPEE